LPPLPAIRVAALALIATSCRAPDHSAAIDPALSSHVPPNTVALAGLNLDELRRHFPKPPAVLEPFRNAHYALIATTGTQILTISRGTDLAVSGPEDLIAAAAAPHPRAGILAIAEPAAIHHAIWIAIRGGTPLPLEGNLANANNLVTLADSLTLTAVLHDAPPDAVDLELAARCPTPATALQFEQRLRALISLSAANTRRPEFAAIQLHREDRVVRATLSTTTASIQLLVEP
jgi:hypothetical protein